MNICASGMLSVCTKSTLKSTVNRTATSPFYVSGIMETSVSSILPSMFNDGKDLLLVSLDVISVASKNISGHGDSFVSSNECTF